MRRMLLHVRDCMTDDDLAAFAGYSGLPFGCHMTLQTGATRYIALEGAIVARIERGDPLATNICYWGPISAA